MKILYFTAEGVSSTVFRSQVYDLVENMSDIDVSIYLLQKFPFAIKLKSLKYFFDKQIKTIFYINKIDYQKEAEILSDYIKEPIIIHCRNIVAAYIGYLASLNNNNIKVIYDVRGAVEEEKKFFNDDRYREFEKMNETLFSTENIYYSFISKELLNYYADIYPIDKTKVVICNSAYNDKVFRLKEATAKKIDKKEIVGIYIGGNQDYQNLDKIIKSFKDKFDKLLIVTSKKIKNPNRDYENVVYYDDLSSNEIVQLAEVESCDYGIIYRTDEIFNKVATPTKVTEYMGMGLKILAINNAGAYTEQMLLHPFLGNIYKDSELSAIQLTGTSGKQKKEISEFAFKNFSQKNNITIYKALYEKIYSRF